MYQVKKHKYKNNTITVIEVSTDELDTAILLNIINKEFTKLCIFSHLDRMTKLHKDIQKAMLDDIFLVNNAKSIFTRIFDGDTAEIICNEQFTNEQKYLYVTLINLPKIESKMQLYDFRTSSDFNREFEYAITQIEKY